ncbi:MAG: hypothetical protein EXS36_02395 [Pedosphaera sp.]|nr:hypothetical protein [Pedosphaera sp.]
MLHMYPTKHRHTGLLEYRLPDDRLSYWTGKYPTAGEVRAFMCAGCGRIAIDRSLESLIQSAMDLGQTLPAILRCFAP